MPDIKDIKDLEDKIKTFGNEDKILKDQENSAPTPPQKESPETEGLMDDILSDFDKGFVLDDNKESSLKNDSLDLDALLGDSEKPLKEESPEDFLASLGDSPTDTTQQENKTSPENIIEDIGSQDSLNSGIDEMSMLLNDMGNEPEPKTAKESFGEKDDITMLAGDFSEPEKSSEASDDFSMSTDDAGLDDLLKNMGEAESPVSPFDKEEGEGLSPEIDALAGIDLETGTGDLLNEPAIEDIPRGLERKQSEETPDSLINKNDELGDLEALLGEEIKAAEPPLSEGMDLSPEEVSFEDVSAALGKDESAKDDISSFDLLDDISSFEVQSKDELNEAPSDMLGMENLGSLEINQIEEEAEAPIQEPAPSGKKEKPFFSMPDELSVEDIKKDNDEDIKLSENERKQILISLTDLPNEAELKISKAIISGKYSNIELKPLINALINSESPEIIISLYEKITKDKSLSKIDIKKHEGASFEERQKSFGYLLEKNILPILSKLAVAALLAVAIMLAFVKIFWPTIQASNYYNKGYKKLENKAFTEVEDYFEKAYGIQPRFKETLRYARGYRKYKRYIEAEKKYELASNIKPSDEPLMLEFADFFRETKDFERSEKKYNVLLRTNKKNVAALLGLAKNYLDWSVVEQNKIDNAKETYLDVLDIEPKNKEAVFGNLNIALKQKNHKDIMKHYSFIENNFKEKIDPETYAKLASYFIDINEVDDAKKVLGKASKALKKGDIFPQIQFEYARYKKYLGVHSEEKKHLQNVLSQFERMKKNEDPRYEDTKYRELLAETYNMLGENAEINVSGNPDAEMYYNKAIQTNPDYGKSYFNLANFALKYKPNGMSEAKEYYLEAENKGFTNDRLDYNLGWLFYKENDFDSSYRRIIKIMEKNPDNTNIKFFIGNIFYKMGKYDLSESMFVELYNHFNTLSSQYIPLEADVKEDIIIMDMMKKITNNLGATYQKRYENTRKSKYLVQATNYYYISTEYFDKLVNTNFYEVDVYREKNTQLETETSKYKKEISHINVRMVLYPDAGLDEPFLYEDFPIEYKIFM